MKTICFIGRRAKNLAGYNDISKYEKFVDMLASYLAMEVTENTTFISGGAQGFDQLAFWAVDIAKSRAKGNHVIRNVIYEPHKFQSNGWVLDDELFGKVNYRKILNAADAFKCLKEDYSDEASIVRALYERNHEMVNDSDFVIALYPDDRWKELKGGTEECMRYAHANGKIIKQITYEINDEAELIPTGLIQNEPGNKMVIIKSPFDTYK